MSPRKSSVQSKSPMAPAKQKVNAMLRDLAPVKFTVHEDEYIRDTYTLPHLFSQGMFKSLACKNAGLRVALNLAECFKLGRVEWSGAPQLMNEFKLRITADAIRLSTKILSSISDLKLMYESFKYGYGEGEEAHVTEVKFAAAFHDMLHEGLRTLGAEDLSGNPGPGYITKDNICKKFRKLIPP